MAIHSWASWALAFSILASLAQIACLALPWATAALSAAASYLCTSEWSAPLLQRIQGLRRWGTAGLSSRPLLTGWAETAAAAFCSRIAAAVGHGQSGGSTLGPGYCTVSAGVQTAVCPCGPPWWRGAALGVFVTSVVLAQCSLAWMAWQSLQLMRALSEEGSDDDVEGIPGSAPDGHKEGASKRGCCKGSSSAVCLGGSSAAILRQAGPICWLRVWIGILVESLVLPPCVAYTLCHDEIEWAGIRYSKHNGKVGVISPAAGKYLTGLIFNGDVKRALRARH